ncbi:serine hydrolase [uncultured Reyranella sp.]|uniref:serine hydrolase n=1 Tax=uncultured Reyranella sp. TaxID=735512 RepID=UPI00259C7DEE|nr:serine hydrolase [uncultured Reyranella sp.]
MMRLLLSLVFLVFVSFGAEAQPVTKEKITAALPKLRELARQAVAKGEVPGLSIGIVYRDEVVFLEGFGVREMGQPDAVTADTVFQLASVSKPLAATVVAALVSDGVVTWDTRIRDLDPDFSLPDAYPTAQVTIRDLLSHRSGLAANAGNDIEDLGFSREEILKRIRYTKPGGSFRAGFVYSNFGFTAGAVAATRPTGKRWDDLAEEKVYRPLGMQSTSSRARDFQLQANRSSLHVRVDGKWTPLVKRNADAQSPAGGVSSNARDMMQWLRLELGNGRFAGRPIIKESALEQTRRPTIVRNVDPKTGVTGFYGMGWNVDFRERGVEWSHAGAFSAGARTLVHMLPAERLGIVILTNAFPTGVPEGLAATFLDEIYAGKASRDWIAHWNEIYDDSFGAGAQKQAMAPYASPPASPSPPLPLQAYTGFYQNDYVGDVRVVESGGVLSVVLGPAGRRFPLKHFNRDLFLYAPYAESPGWTVGVTFQIGPDGRASQVTFENLDEDGNGTLKRTRVR